MDRNFPLSSDLGVEMGVDEELAHRYLILSVLQMMRDIGFLTIP